MSLQRTIVTVFFVLTIGCVPAIAGTPPVDEDVIAAEMEALIDGTPDLTKKERDAAQKLLRKGVKAHDARQFKKAIGLYREALEIDPVSALAYYELAYSYTTMGDQQAALDAIVRAIVLDPKQEIFRILHGSILDDLGFGAEAEAAYRELLEIQPDSYLGTLNLGITLVRNGHPVEAEETFLRAIEIDATHPSAYFHLANLCKTLGYDYDEEMYLEKFIEVGSEDRRLQMVQGRLEELNEHKIEIDPSDPYFAIVMMEKMSRTLWRTQEHREAFPDARGYELTFEEDKDVYTSVLEMWREEKATNPEANHGYYDLLLRIDDAGFLDEYIWYHRQEVFGDRATAWIAEHPDRLAAFLDWARDEGLLKESSPDPAPSQLDQVRGFPGKLFQIVEDSDLLYRILSDPDPPDALLDAERARYARELRWVGENRVPCKKARQTLDDAMPAGGTATLIPTFRCFAPGDPDYEHAARRASSLGLEVREVDFRPVVDLEFGDAIDVRVGSSWMTYGMAKAAWRKEPALREAAGGSSDDTRASLEEEVFAVSAQAGGYFLLHDPEVSTNADEPWDPPERVPALDRLLEAVEAGNLRGFVLYEVIHKAYGIPLDRLEEPDAEAVQGYLLDHVVLPLRQD